MKRKWAVGCVGIPLLILIGLLLFSEWAWGGNIKPSLDPQYIPTAEYLLQHPHPTPVFLSINPSPSTSIINQNSFQITLKFGDKRFGCEGLCLESDSHGADNNFVMWSYVYVNGKRISHNDIYAYSAGNLGSYGLTLNFNLPLSLGLHIFRIQIGSSFNDFLNPDPKLSYEWSYRVE